MAKTYDCPKLEILYCAEDVVRTSLGSGGAEEVGLDFSTTWGNNG